MRYYYLHPRKPRFFFPKGFKRHAVFCSFYQPYSRGGAVAWWLFRNIALYRLCFTKNSIEAFVPEKEIRALAGSDAVMAFNAGTPSPEQKCTALGWKNGEYFFLKYAHTQLSVTNVANECKILRQISSFDFVPRVIDFYSGEQKVLLKTSVLHGRQLGIRSLTPSLFDYLCLLADAEVETEKNFPSDLKSAFAHGDFCPWNMIEADGKILIYDWEMAGTYPLGYDLFTFIFQTPFLLSPQKPIEDVVAENQSFIVQFFDRFGISAWKAYLGAFARIKVEYIKTQGAKELLENYTRLLDYAEKNQL